MEKRMSKNPNRHVTCESFLARRVEPVHLGPPLAVLLLAEIEALRQRPRPQQSAVSDVHLVAFGGHVDLADLRGILSQSICHVVHDCIDHYLEINGDFRKFSFISLMVSVV